MRPMHPRAAHLIETLGMQPHPEGGYFREIYRSSAAVQPADGRPRRVALTTIYFLLTAGDISRWHRVGSDEVWHHYEGDPLELLIADAGFAQISRHTLGPVGARVRPVYTVPATIWQAARSLGHYTLVGCTVGPGFEFADFEMLRDRPDAAELIGRGHADAAPFL